MSAHELLRRLEDLGTNLTLAGDKVRYRSEDQLPAKLLAEMKRHRTELVAILKRRATLQWPPPRKATVTANRQGPMSWAQRQVWATDFFFDDGTYNLSGGLRLKGRLDEDAFQAAFREVQRRHPSLRTVFREKDGTPIQRILPGVASVTVRDLGDRPPNMAFAECLRECETTVAGRLALDQSPPLHTRLYRLAADDHVFFVVLHHVIADGVSIRLLIEDLARCYNSLVEGTVLKPLAHDVDMIDYALFEQEYLQYGDLQPIRLFWRDLLQGIELGSLRLPKPKTPWTSNETGGALEFDVSAQTTARVREVAQVNRSTPFLVVSAALTSMLSRYTGREEMVIGMPVARRERAGLHDLVGLLLDMFPVRLDCRGNPTFREQVQRTRSSVLGAVSKAIVPVELALEDGGHRHDGGKLFNVVLTDNGTRFDKPQFSGLETDFVEVPQATAKFDLNFLVRDDEETLHIDIEFDRQVLSDHDVFAMISMADDILAEGTTDVDRRMLDLAPMTDKQLSRFNIAPSTPADESADRKAQNESLFGRLIAVAKTRDHATAISHAGTNLEYDELCRQVDLVARGLRQKCLGPGDVVAIDLPKGIDLIVALAGIMGSGAAGLVIHDAWPRSRTEQVLRDADVRLIITRKPDAKDNQMTVSELAETGSGTAEVEPVPSNAVAYVIYTSGSTGQPKGVQVTHRNVLNLLDGTRDRFGFNESDIWTLVHACSFDVSIWEIFGCLLSGGRLIVVPDEVIRDPDEFERLLHRESVTVLNLTPSALQASLSVLSRDPTWSESVRYVNFAGEALQPELVNRWYRDMGHRTQIVNLYGITETTVHSTWRWLEPGPQSGESDIGVALPGTSLQLLYDNGKPVHDQCVGEIYVGGGGVSPGYIGRPRETASRFLPDPFTSSPGARMYRSGDLGRRNGSTITYLGRRDNQVQVNGFRVEPGEIEAALIRQPGVSAAAAAMVEDESGNYIVAIIVPERETPESENSLSTAEVLQGIRELLPRYMIPASVTVVPELPLTDNGKLDRAAVIAASAVEVSSPEKPISAAPRETRQRVLAKLFQEVLHIGTVTTETDFFDNGGDSMRAIRLVSLAHNEGLDLSVRNVYANPRLGDLVACAVAMNPVAEADGERPPFSQLPCKFSGSFDDTVVDAYPMTALQCGMMYLKELAPDAGVYHIVLSYRIGGPMVPDAFRAAAQVVTDMHPVLRTSFDMGFQAGPLQRVHWPVEVPVEFHDLRHLDQAAREPMVTEIFERERITEFELTRPALFRLVVLLLSDEEYQLLFTHHHAIMDGWSVNVFFEDLHSIYMQKLSGGPETDDPPELQNVFAEYVVHEQHSLDQSADAEFWQERTAIDAGLLVPNRKSKPIMRQIRVEMPPGMIAKLRRLASGLGVPAKVLLFAAHLRVMAWLTGRNEVVTGQVISCRPEMPDSDRALGLFLNEYPVRVQLAGLDWGDLARILHQEEQDMMPHRWYPHARIQQNFGPTPIFDNYFNFTDFHRTRRLVSQVGLDVLDVKELESTHYAMGSNFTVDVRTGELRLILEYDESAVPQSTAALAADAFGRTLEAMLMDPQAPCLASPLPGIADVVRNIRNETDSAAKSPLPPEDNLLATKPASGSDSAVSPVERHAPYSKLEESVLEVWKEVLEDEQFDVNANFFNVGGTSLSAMRVVARLRTLHGTLSMETFMSQPTIAALAKALDDNQPESGRPSATTSRTVPKKAKVQQTYPLTRTQENLWQIANYLPGLPVFSMPGSLQADGPLDLDLLGQTFTFLADRHAALRTRIVNTETGPVQIVDPDSSLKFEMIDLGRHPVPAARCEELMSIAVLKPIDLSRSPLVNLIVFRLAGQRHVIFLNMHHIVCDGWSLNLLLSEAAQVYRQLLIGVESPALPGVPMGCGELAEAELDWADSPHAASQRQYWVDRLAPPWPASGGDNRFGKRKDPGLKERMQLESCRRHLTPKVIESLSLAARQHSMTEFMIVLATFASTLREWSDCEDIRIGTMMANRIQAERESAVGLLANTVILRLNVGKNHDPVELVHQSRRVCIDAFERQELPFEDVQQALNARYPAESQGGPLFEVMLLMQEESSEIVNDQELRFSPYIPQHGALKPPVTPTMCEFVLVASRTLGGELELELQYMPAVTAKSEAEALLEDVAAAIGSTVEALREHA